MDSKDMFVVSRKPTHPGEMLREEFLPEYNLSVAQAAHLLHVSRQSVNELVRERRSVSADMAVRLARLFGISPQYWLNMQRNIDLWNALDLHGDDLLQVNPLASAVNGTEIETLVG